MAGSARALTQRRPLGDRVFQALALVAGLLVLAILVLIAVATTQQSTSWFSHEGITGIFSTTWDPAHNKFGALSFIYGSVVTALIAVVLVMLATSVCLAVLAYGGWLAVWHLAVASFVNGIVWAADNPVRRVMIGEVVGPTQTGPAMSVDVGANNASRMLGPTIGGLLLAGIGISGAFTVSVLCYGVALVAALRLQHRNTIAPAEAGGAVLTRMLEGLALVRRDPRVIGTLVVTVVYNVFGWPFTSMIPVIVSASARAVSASSPAWTGSARSAAPC